MREPRAQIGEPSTDLALEQGCSCFLDKEECLVHGDVVAYVVELTYIGRKRLLTGPNSFIHIPIKREIKFFDNLYDATGWWTGNHKLLETVLFIKDGKNRFRSCTIEEYKEREGIKDQILLAVGK